MSATSNERARARKALKGLVRRGAIREWGYVQEEDVFYIWFLDDTEIELTAMQVAWMNVGYLSAIASSSYTSQEYLRAIEYLKKRERKTYPNIKDYDPNEEQRDQDDSQR